MRFPDAGQFARSSAIPEATIPTLFIPLFFLVVNIGQVSKTFPSTTPFLNGQVYVAFQLPVSLMFAVATASRGPLPTTDAEVTASTPVSGALDSAV